MYKSYLILAALITFVACNTNKKNQTADGSESASDTTTMRTQIPHMQCYANTTGRDTIFLKLEKFPNVVTGFLKYKLYEKDANHGELDGRLYGDTLIADYKFESEGKESVRQVAFLIKGNIVKEGYGDMEEKKGKMVFKNTDRINFNNGLQLNEIACPVE
ncbi:MAG TPA: hypothetical protein VFW07_11080 [Parafilimonas sp.]|nr:hypothetical protein [Parafilimonas sp.]